MRWRVENSDREENGAWRSVIDWLMSEFLPVGRSGPDALDGGVAKRCWSSHWKSLPNFFSER